jgi:hypothetical protein
MRGSSLTLGKKFMRFPTTHSSLIAMSAKIKNIKSFLSFFQAMKIWLLVFACVLSESCSSGPSTSANYIVEKDATVDVYVFRDAVGPFSSSAQIHIDGHLMDKVRRSSYCKFRIQAGKRLIRVTFPRWDNLSSLQKEIDFESGSSKYILLSSETVEPPENSLIDNFLGKPKAFGVYIKPVLYEIDSETAQKYLVSRGPS